MEKRWLLVGLVATLLGCGGGGGGDVDAATPGEDANIPDTNVPVDAFVAPTPPVQLMGGGAPDYTCIGTATAPAAGDDVTVTLHAIEFLSDANIANQAVELWTTNVIGTGACAAPDCIPLMTDAAGEVDATIAGGAWYAYRLPASAMTAQVLAYNRPAPTSGGGTDQVTAFSTVTVNTVSALLARPGPTATTGAASGTVQDCMGRGVMNARIRIFQGDTEVIGGAPTDRATPRITGLEGTSPTASALTGSAGNFVGANIPAGDYRVEVYGVLTEGGESELLGCEEGRIAGGGITVYTVGGVRSDYADGSGCGS